MATQPEGNKMPPRRLSRRDLNVLGASAVAGWPLVARAQQQAMPVIGFLSPVSFESDSYRVTAFRQGLNEAGYVEGRNVSIEFRWADGQYDRLPGLAADLVGQQVAVIVAGPLPATLAAKAATSTIPIVFSNGNDPVKLGLVASLNRPGGNVTGVSFLINVLAAKQLQLLHETVPKAMVIGFLLNPNNPNAEIDAREVHAAADVLGRKLLIVNASTQDELDAAFAKLAQQRIDALLVHADAFLTSRQEQLATLAARHVIPTIFHSREFTTAGGLMSYGASIADGYR